MNAKKLFKPKSPVRQPSRMTSKKSLGLGEPQGCIYTIKDGLGDEAIRGEFHGAHGKCCLEINRLRTELDSLKKENDLYRERFEMERENHRQLREFYQHRELEWNEIIEHHKRMEKNYGIGVRNLQSETQIANHGSGLQIGMQTGLHNGLSHGYSNRFNNGLKNALKYGLKNVINYGLENGMKNGIKNDLSNGINSGKQSRLQVRSQSPRYGFDRGHSASQLGVILSSPMQSNQSRVKSRQWRNKADTRMKPQWRFQQARLQTAKSTSTLNSGGYQMIREYTQPPQDYEIISPRPNTFTSVVMAICSEMKLNNVSLSDIQHYDEMRKLHNSTRNKSKDHLTRAIKRLYDGEMRDEEWQGLWEYVLGEVGNTSGVSIYNYLFLQISKMFRNMDSKHDILNESRTQNGNGFKIIYPQDNLYGKSNNADTRMNSLGDSRKVTFGNGDSITIMSRGEKEGDSVTYTKKKSQLTEPGNQNQNIFTNQSSEMTLSIVGSIEIQDSYEVYPVSRTKDPISIVGNLINAHTGWGLRKDTGLKKDLGRKSKGYAETVRRIQRINTVESLFQDDGEEEEVKVDISEVRDVGDILRQNRQNISQNILPD